MCGLCIARVLTILRLFLHSPNFDYSSSELTEIGHQNLSSYGELALVSLNVTQLLSHWILNQQPAPTQQTIYLELNELNGVFVYSVIVVVFNISRHVD